VKISIVIPVYNKGKLFLKPLESIATQGHRGEFECILVDDGCTDEDGKLCDEYAARYPDIFKVIHQQNAGRCAARNAGMDIATGEWIGFMDCDDAVMPDFMDRMLEYVGRFDASIIQFGYTRSNLRGWFKRSRVASKEEFLPFTDIHGWALCWNKLYRQAFLAANNIRFYEDAVIKEDEVFNIWALSLSGGMQLVPYIGYRKYDYAVRGLRLRTVDQLRKADLAFDRLKTHLEAIGVKDDGVYKMIASRKESNLKDISHVSSPFRQWMLKIRKALFSLRYGRVW